MKGKVLVLGDIHGRTIWKDIIEEEHPDFIIFLGDYVSTHDNISSEQQISNLEDIISYKEDHLDSVILLRGNHDCQFLGYYWAECSGLDRTVLRYMSQPEFREKFLSLTQWIYVDNKTIFSHAGVSQVWMDNSGIKDVNDINNLEPSELFGFNPDSPFDYSGNSITQPLTWIRPTSLAMCNVIGYDQVIGHTPIGKITNMKKETKGKQNIWLCDALGSDQYLVIENSIFDGRKRF